jgi:outer membrane receptor protein involved in Fe transport
MLHRRAIAGLLYVSLQAGAMLGQSSTQGAIGGTVLDRTEAVVPRAVVTIRNEANNALFHAVVDANGFFSVPLLEPGIYTVAVVAPGFEEYRALKVVVQVGQVTQLQPRLSVGDSGVSVTVTANVPLMNLEDPAVSSNVNLRAIEAIPVNNRRWSALALLTPGVTGDLNGYGLVSVRGISPILNNVEIDGADDNQAYSSEERGRTREAYSTAASAVREFEVNSGVYPAEFGRAAGGVLNSVTKSGTNELHGALYGYDRESKWNAYNDQATITTLNAVTNLYATSPVKPEDVRKIYGFTVGAPIVNDRLFFLYTYDQHSRIFPLLGVSANPSSFFALPDAEAPTGSTCNTSTGYLSGTSSVINILDAQACTLAARLNLGSYTAGAAKYSQGIAVLNTDLGPIPRTGYQEINQPKFDYEIDPREHLSLLYNRLRWDSPGGVQTTSTGNYALDATGTDFVKLDYGVAKLTSTLAARLGNELLYQYGRELNDSGQSPLSEYSRNNLQAADGNVPYVSLDPGIGFNLGSPYFSHRQAYPDERKWQAGDTLYLQAGRHNVKFGTDMVHNYDLLTTSAYYEGLFTYSNNIVNYLSDLDAKGLGHGVCDSAQQTTATATVTAVGLFPCYTQYTQSYGPTSFDLATLDYAFFLQDNWKITRRLTLDLGIRYDEELLPKVSQALTAAVGTFVPFTGLKNNPSDKNNFGPRIGFAYDVHGDGKMSLRGGYGLYYGRLTNGNQFVALQATGSPLTQSTTTVRASTGLSSEPLFPNRLTINPLSTSTVPSAYFRAANLQNPQVHEIDFQVQRELGRGTVVQGGYLGAFGRELPNFLDVNLDPATKQTVNISVVDPTGRGPIPNGTILRIPTFTRYGNMDLLGPSAANFQSITELISNINSSYHALFVEVQNRSLKSVQFDLNYTWSHALDFFQTSSQAGVVNNWYNPYENPRSNYGNSSFNIPNRLVGYVLYSLPNLRKRGGLQCLTTDWNFDDSFQMQTTLPFSANVSGTNSTPVKGSSSAVAADLNGNGGVANIPQLGINNHTQRMIVVNDVRVEKAMKLRDRYELKIALQIFNVANHQNVSTENTIAYKLAGTAGTAFAGTATYQPNFGTIATTNNSGFSYTPRELELAVRVAF